MTGGRRATAPSASTAEQVLAALDVPLTDETRRVAVAAPGRELWRFGERLITPSTAKALWLQWHPHLVDDYAKPDVAREFRRLLVDGFELGLKLSRFKHKSAALTSTDRWSRLQRIDAFEDCVAFDDFGTLSLHLSPEDHEAIRYRDRKGQTLDELLQTLADGIFYELGLVHRRPTLNVDTGLTSPWFRCEWNDLVLPPIEGLARDEVLVNDTPDRMTLLNITADEWVNPANGGDCARISSSAADIVEQAGLTTWDWRGYLTLWMSAVLSQAAGAFINSMLVELYMMRLREFSPELVDTVEQRFERSFLVQMLRSLLADGISIRNLPRVLDASVQLRALADVDYGQYIVFAPMTEGVHLAPGLADLTALEPHHYAEFVRTNLKREISHKYSRDQNAVTVYLLDPEAEERVQRSNGLDDAELAAFLEAVKQEVGTLPATTQTPPLLTSIEIRRHVRRLIAPDWPHLAVLSYQELSPDMNIQPIARISPDFET